MDTSLKIFLFILLALCFINTAISPVLSEEHTDTGKFVKPLFGHRLIVVDVTGYSSSFDETDHDPWVTAMNTKPRWGIVASNDLPLGTRIRIPELFGNQIFYVEDRMNRRFSNRIDVWFTTKKEALLFGFHKDIIVEILE